MIEQFDTEIFAHDADGEDHRPRVAEHPGPLISIGDDNMPRILAPAAASALYWQLARIITRHALWRGRAFLRQHVSGSGLR
jgi:hypothetical protein